MITQYEDFLRHVYENGVAKTDRTGTGTRSVFGYQMRFDLMEGFPLVTTKKVPVKAIIAELIWILSGSTNNNDLRALGATIWDEWAREDGDLGPIYGEQFRQLYSPTEDVKLIDTRHDKHADFVYPFSTDLLPAIECDLNSAKCWAVGGRVENGNTVYAVQFASGFVGELTRPNWRAAIAANSDFSRQDGYAENVAGVGFMGAPSKVDERLYTMWANMIERCYNNSHPSYSSYGARGVTVSPIWHSFEYFSKTIQSVPGYHRWESGQEMCLDKDYFGAGVYGPSTSIFLSHQHNTELTGTPARIAGKVWTSVTAWARHEGVDANYAKKRWAAGATYHGIAREDVKLLEHPEGKLWRRAIVHDQITEAMRLLRDDPDSRRIVVSAWNVADLPKMALSPCCALSQFYTTPMTVHERCNVATNAQLVPLEGKDLAPDECHEILDEQGVPRLKLSCQLYQRSADIFLGVPFNIASYSLLTMMVAQQLGMSYGEFIWTGGDCHIYSNHFEQVELQLSRKPYSRPRMILPAEKPADLFSYKVDDFQLVGYAHHEAIKAPVAV